MLRRLVDASTLDLTVRTTLPRSSISMEGPASSAQSRPTTTSVVLRPLVPLCIRFPLLTGTEVPGRRAVSSSQVQQPTPTRWRATDSNAHARISTQQRCSPRRTWRWMRFEQTTPDPVKLGMRFPDRPVLTERLQCCAFSAVRQLA